MKVITSTSNPLIQQIKKLHFRKHRYTHNKFIAEGMRVISTLMDNKLELVHVFLTEDTNDFASFYPDSKCIEVSEKTMNALSTSKSPCGILAVFTIPKPPQLKDLSSGAVLAQINDPGNMGTLIRTTAAMGLKTVWCIEGVDPWNAKVVQASAGTIGAVNVFQRDWQTLIDNKGELKLAALVVADGQEPSVLQPNSLLVIGNEANGLPTAYSATCNQQITLPMPGATESLNAAVAGSIALYLLGTGK